MHVALRFNRRNDPRFSPRRSLTKIDRLVTATLGLLATLFAALGIVATSAAPALSQTRAQGCALQNADPGLQVLTCPGFRIDAEASATLHIGEARPGRADSLRLQGGAAYIDVTPGRSGSFQILTPRAIASVRGTRFAVDDASPATSVFVASGRVTVSRRRGGPGVTLSEGEGVDVDAGDAPLAVKRWPQSRVNALMARLGR